MVALLKESAYIINSGALEFRVVINLTITRCLVNIKFVTAPGLPVLVPFQGASRDNTQIFLFIKKVLACVS